ncbi:MAG TPA: sigma-54 dependent transcriptional regulator [Geobacteraceae bacterium]
MEFKAFATHRIVGKSRPIQKVLETVRCWGNSDEHVLICGESGTGKDLVARAVHDVSSRARKPFIAVNCGQLNVHTAESELFGHVHGAFTGAVRGRTGLFESADSGTLFMDEISEMPLDVQVKLLRVLETSTFRSMGSNRDIKVDVRIVFASNRNLESCISRGQFREDLFHRINTLPISLPSLRERTEDILPLVQHFLDSAGNGGHEGWRITADALSALRSYSWPGNVRELKNVIRRACLLATDSIITTDLLPFAVPKASHPRHGKVLADDVRVPLWVVERGHIQRVLELARGNKTLAARILEVDRKTLYCKLKRYGLDL